jgi:molybdopterin-guanine dinucleotide biosynthesis protein A
MVRTQPHVVHIAGDGAAGLIERIAGALADRGYRIACLREGAAAGWPGACGAAGVADAGGTALWLPPEPWPDMLGRVRRALCDYQLILVQGFSGEARELIEAVAPGKQACHAGRRALRAVIGAGACAGVPYFAREDVRGQCAFIEERYLQPNLSGAILAGGRSSRLGRDKTMVPVGGRPVIERMIALLERHALPVKLITGNAAAYARYGLAIVADVYPGCGPLSGIHAALESSATDYVLVLSGDMPLVRDDLVERLLSACAGHDITLYKHKNFEPLCAVYRRSCLEALEELLRHGDGRIIDLFPALTVKVLRTGEPEVFTSINTDEDYRFIMSRLASGA